MIKKAHVEKSSIADLPVLPSIGQTLDGANFSTAGDVWSVRSHTTACKFNFRLCERLSEELLHSLRLVVLWYIENKSVMHARGCYERFSRFFSWLSSGKTGDIKHLSSIDILNYRASLATKNQWYVATLAGFLKKWHDLGYPGVDEEVIRLLDDLKLSGNTKGEAVLTMDPEKGPFSDIEFEALHSAVNKAFAEGSLELEEYVLAWLFLVIGARPVQYAALKVKDLSKVTDGEGNVIYALKVPRAKQRNTLIRDDFKVKQLIPQIGQLVERHIGAVKSSFADDEDCFTDPETLPMFPLRNKAETIPGYDYHTTGANISARLRIALEKLEVISERTGKKMSISARRFRYTLGTRAAMEGAGELVIAELLDHSDTQNVGVYVEARPEIVERIDKALALQMAPMAQAFCGMLVTQKSDAVRGDDPTSLVIDPLAAPAKNPVGNCGMHGFCGFAAPVACYTCRNFQPWLDGPHEAVLERLIRERDDVLARGGDLRIASVNDRTIFAVAEVVQRCNNILNAQEVA